MTSNEIERATQGLANAIWESLWDVGLKATEERWRMMDDDWFQDMESDGFSEEEIDEILVNGNPWYSDEARPDKLVHWCDRHFSLDRYSVSELRELARILNDAYASEAIQKFVIPKLNNDTTLGELKQLIRVFPSFLDDLFYTEDGLEYRE